MAEASSPRLAVAPTIYLLLAGMSLFWGLNWIAGRIVLVTVPPLTFRAISMLTGGGLLMLLMLLLGESLAVRRGERLRLAILAQFNIAGFNICIAYGQLLMPTGRAAIVAFTMPLWAALLSMLLLHQRLSLRTWLAQGLGLAGIACLLVPGLIEIGRIPLGIPVILCGSISWALGTVLSKRWQLSIATLPSTAWQVTLGGVAPLIGALILERQVDLASALDLTRLIALTYIILLPVLFCNFAWFKIVAVFPASVVGVTSLMIPVVAVFSAGLVLGEKIGMAELLALGLIVSAVALVLFPGPDLAKTGA